MIAGGNFPMLRGQAQLVFQSRFGDVPESQMQHAIIHA